MPSLKCLGSQEVGPPPPTAPSIAAAKTTSKRKHNDPTSTSNNKKSKTESSSTSASATTAAPTNNKKKKKAKDPNAPKRYSPSYIHYQNTVRPNIVAENPDLSFVLISQLIGQRWKALTSDEKQPYEDMYDKDKARYGKEMEIYTASKDGGGGVVEGPRRDCVDDNNIMKVAGGKENAGADAVAVAATSGEKFVSLVNAPVVHVPLLSRENSSGAVSSIMDGNGGHLRGDDDEGDIPDSKLGKKCGKVDEVEKKEVESAKPNRRVSIEPKKLDFVSNNMMDGNEGDAEQKGKVDRDDDSKLDDKSSTANLVSAKMSGKDKVDGDKSTKPNRVSIEPSDKVDPPSSSVETTWTLKLLPMSREAAAEALTKKGIRVPTDPNYLVTAKKNEYGIPRKTITMSVSTLEKTEKVVLGRNKSTGIQWSTVSRQLCEINMVSPKLEDTAVGPSISTKVSISMLLKPGDHALYHNGIELEVPVGVKTTIKDKDIICLYGPTGFAYRVELEVNEES